MSEAARITSHLRTKLINRFFTPALTWGRMSKNRQIKGLGGGRLGTGYVSPKDATLAIK
jgi:hypothetical protein